MRLEDKGGQRLRRKLADPAHAQRVAEIREGMWQMEDIPVDVLDTTFSQACVEPLLVLSRLGSTQQRGHFVGAVEVEDSAAHV